MQINALKCVFMRFCFFLKNLQSFENAQWFFLTFSFDFWKEIQKNRKLIQQGNYFVSLSAKLESDGFEASRSIFSISYKYDAKF